MKSSLTKWILDAVNPVCQNESAKLYCWYGSEFELPMDGTCSFDKQRYSKLYSSHAPLVRLVPYRDPNDTSRILGWGPDPKDIERLGLTLPHKQSATIKSSTESVVDATLNWCGRTIEGWFDSVCQDIDSVLYGEYGDDFVQLVPVVDKDNPSRIVSWIPDPHEVEELRKVDEISENGIVNKSVAKVVPNDSFVVIDGSNVICYGDEKCGNGVRGTKVLSALVNSLMGNGYQCKVFLDGSMIGRLKHKENDESGLRYLKEGEKNGLVVIAPGRVEADGQILQFATHENNVHIITNDHYRDYREMYPWLNDDAARLHGINVVRMGDGRFRILVAGFNLDITVRA